MSSQALVAMQVKGDIFISGFIGGSLFGPGAFAVVWRLPGFHWRANLDVGGTFSVQLSHIT